VAQAALIATPVRRAARAWASCWRRKASRRLVVGVFLLLDDMEFRFRAATALPE